MASPSPSTLPPLPLPKGTTSSYADCRASCGLNVHYLSSGTPGNPLILFCHGFPELAYSWRRVLPAIAKLGYYCVAPDQRGYGRTTGPNDGQSWEQVDLGEYVLTNLVRDMVCFVYKLGYKQVECVVGHDFGAVSSAMCALMRPDIFKSTIQMSHPHHAPPSPPFGLESQAKEAVDIQAELAKLQPPRKHYKWYNSSASAARDWENPEQGLEEYLRGYFHLKSADWKANNPRPLREWSAEAVAEMPEYYIMRKEHTFPQSIAANMMGEDATATERWLSQQDLQVFVQEWSRTGFQGALNWYRAQTASTPQSKKDLLLFAGRRIEVPCAFISGEQDWGNYQQPGAFESYEDPKIVAERCFRGATMVEGAGHWVQQEKSQEVVEAIARFLNTL